MSIAELFRRGYERGVLLGLAAAVWFAALARAAHDLWAASAMFAWATLLACVFFVGRALDSKPVRLPLLLPCLLFLAGAALSNLHSFDRWTTALETWIWAFCFLLALLFVNVAQDRRDLELFAWASSAALVPLAFLIGAKLQRGGAIEGIASTFGRHLAIVILFFGVFWAAILFCVRALERKTGKDALWAFSAFACAAALRLLFTRWDIYYESVHPLINHNVLVGFALYWFFFLWKKAFERSGHLLSFLPAFLVMIAARSWWSHVAILLGLLFYYRIPLRRMIAEHRAAFLGAACAAAALLLALVALKARQHTQLIQGMNRFHWWTSALRMFLAHPLTGVGAGGFATAYPFYRAGAAQGTLHAHSFPLQLLAETGAAGALAALLLGAAYRRLLLRSPEGAEDRRVFQATLACVLCFAAIHISLEYFLNKLLFVILLGSALVGRRLPAFRLRPLWCAAAPFFLVLLSPFWLGLLVSDRLCVAARRQEERGDLQRAEELYKSALSVEPSNAECYWGLSRLSSRRYGAAGDRRARAESWDYLREGLRYKKDIGYFEEAQAARLDLQAR